MLKKKKLCFIIDNPDVTKPKFGDKSYDAWVLVNSMVVALLHKSMNTTIKQCVMWIILLQRYGQIGKKV